MGIHIPISFLYMLILIQSSFIITSITILWRSTLRKNSNLGPAIRKKFPVFIGVALTCGTCFSYWIVLIFVLVCRPFPIGYFSFVPLHTYWVHVFFSWMYLGFSVVLLRFLFALIQEKVDYFHLLNNHGEHKH